MVVIVYVIFIQSHFEYSLNNLSFGTILTMCCHDFSNSSRELGGEAAEM